MALKTSEAITLRTYRYQEADRIAVFFTRDYGKVRAIARGALRPKSQFGSTLEPMSHVRLIFFSKENQELASINSCDLLQSHARLRASLEGSYYCAYFSELISEFTQEGEASEKSFRLLLSVLGAPDTPLDARARYLETWMLRLEGVFPSLVQCGHCGRSLDKQPVFLPSGAHQALCRQCAGRSDMRLGASQVELVRTIFARRISDIDWTGWDAAVLKNLGSLNFKLIQYHLEKPLKTARFLKEVFRAANDRTGGQKRGKVEVGQQPD